MTEDEVKAALRLTPENPVRKAIQQILAETLEDETDTALRPNLTDADRHFNAGRAACARDTQDIFLGLFSSLTSDKVS